MKQSEVKPKLGISSCLLGSEVRYDGGRKHNAFVYSLALFRDANVVTSGP